MSPFLACRVHYSKALRDVLVALERGAAGIALVVDAEDRLVGILTDGDVRRALLANATLESPLSQHLQRRFTAVPPEVSRADVIDLMRARSIDQIPIVDSRGRLVGLHLIHEILGASERPNWAVLMAGGEGRRLRPMTQFVPKPMLKVAGRPILERLVLHLVGFGIRRIFLAIHYLGEMVVEHFQDGSRFGCRIDYLREEEPLGTGGALSLLPEMPREPLLVMNGDLVTQANLAAMFAFHAQRGRQATVGVRHYVHQIPFGCVEAQGDRLEKFEEKPALTRLVNAGIYIFEPALLQRLPKAPFPLPAVLEECLSRNEEVGVFEIVDEWLDIGQHEQLKQVREGKA